MVVEQARTPYPARPDPCTQGAQARDQHNPSRMNGSHWSFTEAHRGARSACLASPSLRSHPPSNTLPMPDPPIRQSRRKQDSGYLDSVIGEVPSGVIGGVPTLLLVEFRLCYWYGTQCVIVITYCTVNDKGKICGALYN
ncbi:hypothetical protein Pmani_030455 [Petrolisthes manimaculis]|uniref:Uncharacterized protein n=1 Tax=Petrolisthes manimaculis TaxID=1843537 RepID=A0AAE1TSV0_9EUCA|nr:hypothetical protein Pmani_030455 [Petrolisthes manimaculis]